MMSDSGEPEERKGETGGVISAAAARLGVPRTTLNAVMHKLGVSRRDL